jgi:hypothetical protein
MSMTKRSSFLAAAAVLAITSIAGSQGAYAASGPPSPDAAAVATRAVAMPLRGTPADWATWSSNLSTQFHSAAWSSVVAGHGCTLIQSVTSDFASDGSAQYGGIPKGTVIPAETLVIQCGSAGAPSFQVVPAG